MTFHSSAVMGAGDDFLAGVTALLEIDGAQFFQPQHLRHEMFRSFRIQYGLTGKNPQQRPRITANRTRVFLLKNTPEQYQFFGLTLNNKARRSTRQPDESDTVFNSHGIYLSRCRTTAGSE